MSLLRVILEYRKDYMIKDNRHPQEYKLSKLDMLPLLDEINSSDSWRSNFPKVGESLFMFKETGDYKYLADALRGGRIFGMDIKLEVDKTHPLHGNPFDMC